MYFSALVPVRGKLRRIVFEAEDESDALCVAEAARAGLEGPALKPGIPEPLAYPIKEACRLLGGVSRATIYNWLALGELERLPGTARVLITRRSLERKAGRS